MNQTEREPSHQVKREEKWLRVETQVHGQLLVRLVLTISLVDVIPSQLKFDNFLS